MSNKDNLMKLVSKEKCNTMTRNKKRIEVRKFDVYCKICGGCGEDGCCSAASCEQHKDGMYCESYLNDLRFSHLMFNDIYELLEGDLKKKVDIIYDKNSDIIYKPNNKNIR